MKLFMADTNDSFDIICQDLRTSLKEFVPQLKALEVTARETTPADNAEGDTEAETQDEMAENAILALRHLEDAIMRIGKCIQAFEGGVNPLDKPAPAAEAGVGESADAGAEESAD